MDTMIASLDVRDAAVAVLSVMWTVSVVVIRRSRRAAPAESAGALIN